MNSGSFTAKTRGTLITYTETAGFSCEEVELAEILNDELSREPGQTHTPPALLASMMLQRLLPSAVISDLVYAPLDPVANPEKAIP